MSYLQLLGLKKEPFSNSPDPAFFYPYIDSEECSQRLEISIRLRRGLNLILGDVGVGKTTFSRLMLRRFQEDGLDFVCHLMLDPGYRTEFQFVKAMAQLFGVQPSRESTAAYKNVIENYLFQTGVEEQKIIILIVDEGQKLTPPLIEILRTMLNFETNEYKLLQLIIMAQLEFLDVIKKHHNFCDRINLKYHFQPLELEDTRRLIEYRLETAGLQEGRRLFSDEVYPLIHEQSQGRPRQIINICHHSLVSMLIKEKELVDEDIVRYTLKSIDPISS